ncbi:hypothetical protein CFBP498_13770 [Xanthomonas hortorum pv. vitians]|uniref:Uncharacterized protein n=1 Tax=Xanthomonas hortorum pv. vitians TaxID=83224 RepID=A0A6V7CI70_9XANT|nr:hypothetical protein CFBP498_13770 [Xanthomonas hortorum pv. vitians]CAD0316991.1 hypothetical protein CFBP498_13770 [Xanthomonas hortorum pv. vitians]CAH2706867.1 hypothetical protein NCPPB1935_03645 [Xanthomonas campestris pv. nigromaculans]
MAYRVFQQCGGALDRPQRSRRRACIGVAARLIHDRAAMTAGSLRLRPRFTERTG